MEYLYRIEHRGSPHHAIKVDATWHLVEGSIFDRYTTGARIDGAPSTGNIVQGNYIGTNASGSADLGNSLSGVYIRRAPGNLVIGNVVSGNDGFAGIAICGNAGFCGGGDAGTQGNNASGNVVRGNLIGTDAAESAVLGNSGFGVSIDGAPNTVVGGPASGEANGAAAAGKK